MKELSIEEKAKHYDEAIEALRSLFAEQAIKHCDRVNIKDITNIFSELKESEDERIMKDIVEAVELHKDFTQGRKEHIYAWLEKQGEQKSTEEYNITGIGSKNAQGKLGEMIKNLKPVNEVLEQKSAELSEEIPTDLKDIVDKEANAIWKEESSDGCHLVIDSFNMFFGICMQIAEAVVDYKKPAWSEEDEKKRKRIMHRLSIDGTINNKDLADINDWLKSLIPQNTWRPSDEQIEALLKLEEMHVLEHEKNQENAHLYMMVKSIREQLLKLREE